MVIRGGENIYSSEVENVLYEHPAVTDCALIGIPHRTLGEEPAAVVHLAPGHDRERGASCRPGCASGWRRSRRRSRCASCHETLPRNANGKILKKDLKALFADRTERPPERRAQG